MSALTAAELAAIRADINSLLPDQCNILTVTTSVNYLGDTVETWGTASSGVACRLDKRRGYEELSGGAIQPFSRWILTLPHNTTITAKSRIQHGGITYAVVEPPDGDKSWKASIRCEVEPV